MRLFTALWPPPEVCDALAAALGGAVPPGPRTVPRERWHLTLAFHGDGGSGDSGDGDGGGDGGDVPARRVAVLDALAGARAPRLRLAGTGTFPGVLWAGLATAGPDDAAALRALVVGAGGDPDRFVGHLTLARSRRDRPAELPDLPDLPPGPWWVPREVLLVETGRDADGKHYRPVHRVALGAPAGPAPAP